MTDPARLIVNGLAAVPTPELENFINNYIAKEEVIKIIIGFPMHKDGQPTYLAADIQVLKTKLIRTFPDIEVILHDERYSSVAAREILTKSGVPKMKRRSKDMLDKISAVIILQDYLQHI